LLKIHLDTDLGGDLDDLCALALLARPDVDWVGVTTVADAAGYARYVLQLAVSYVRTRFGLAAKIFKHRVGKPTLCLKILVSV